MNVFLFSFTYRSMCECVRKVYAIILQFIAIEFEYVKTKPSKAKNIIRFRQLGKMCREAVPMYTARTSYRCGWQHQEWSENTRENNKTTVLTDSIDLNFNQNIYASMALATTRHFDLLESLHNIGFWYRLFTEINIKFCILISRGSEACIRTHIAHIGLKCAIKCITRTHLTLIKPAKDQVNRSGTKSEVASNWINLLRFNGPRTVRMNTKNDEHHGGHP